MLKPPFSVLQKREHNKYVDYIEKSTLTKQTEADTTLVIKDTDEFYRKIEHCARTETEETRRI